MRESEKVKVDDVLMIEAWFKGRMRKGRGNVELVMSGFLTPLYKQ